MAILLSRLCETAEKNHGMKLVAGRDGLDNPVRWVHIIEDVAFTEFLHGNELIFTTGIRQQGVDWLIGFVLALRDKGVVGLVVNTGPYMTEIPPQVIVFCEKSGFPLFTIPWEERIIDITYEFCHRIISSEENEMTVAAAMRNLIFSPENEEGYKNAMLRAGFHSDSRYTVMAVRLRCGGEAVKPSEWWKKYNYKFSKLIKKSPYPTAALMQEASLIVVRQNSPPEQMVELLSAMKAVIDGGDLIYAGVSREADGWLAIPTLYNEAVSAQTVAVKRGREAVKYADIGIYTILFGVRDIGILKSYVRSAIGTLIDYDRQNGTDYVGTLRMYLEENGSVQKIAANMGVHRNTVNYKIKAIREILHTDMGEDDKMKYLLAFYILDMLESD